MFFSKTRRYVRKEGSMCLLVLYQSFRFKTTKRTVDYYLDKKFNPENMRIYRIIGRATKISQDTALSPKRCDILHLLRGNDSGLWGVSIM